MYSMSGDRQRGAALIVALLIVALVVLLSTRLANDFLLIFKRVENQLYTQQADAFLLGAQGVARAALLMTINKDDPDTLWDDWHQPQAFPTDYGVLRGQLTDLQGRFNLNNLALAAPSGQAYNVHQRRFIRLLQLLDVTPAIDVLSAEAITEAITARLNDTAASTESAFYYEDTPPAMRMPHGPMMDVSELRLSPGVDQALYEALRPHVTVWPISGASALNINTASKTLLQTLAADDNLTPVDASLIASVVEERKRQQGFDSVEQFAHALPGISINAGGLGVNSDYFLLSADMDFLGRKVRRYSVLHRDKDKKTVKVIARSHANL